MRLWRKGQPARERVDWRIVIRRLFREVLLQERVWGRGIASLAHVLLFSGFVVLMIGTTLIGIEHFLADILGREPAPHFARRIESPRTFA